ncbi:hypothetical protein HT031_003185 [Scenedesmus sp. PABB004]|nr:hypothetical protein HT031_003185 [Scenedesmus sp. PABB004]
MSKKNNRAIMARKHAHDLALEKAAREAAQRKQAKADRKKARQLAATGEVKTKRKGLRIRKGVKIRGIKITDSESKRRALELLQSEQAAKVMDAEGPGAEGGEGAEADAAGGRRGKKKRGAARVKVVTKRAGGKRAGAAAAAGDAAAGDAAAAAAPMES